MSHEANLANMACNKTWNKRGYFPYETAFILATITIWQCLFFKKAMIGILMECKHDEIEFKTKILNAIY